jgi:antitoxin HigA-1
MKSLRNPARRPIHPGAVLREDILPALKMRQTELAALIVVSRLSVSELVHEKRAMSPEMAVRIATLLNTSAESWLRMQEAVDLWAVLARPRQQADPSRIFDMVSRRR